MSKEQSQKSETTHKRDNYQIIHSRGKVIPLNRWNEVLFL